MKSIIFQFIEMSQFFAYELSNLKQNNKIFFETYTYPFNSESIKDSSS